MDNILYFIPSAGILALLFVYLKNNWVASKEVGSEKMGRIAKNIADGAMAFLRAEYKILSVFVILTAILLGFKGVSEGTSYLFCGGCVMFWTCWFHWNESSDKGKCQNHKRSSTFFG